MMILKSQFTIRGAKTTGLLQLCNNKNNNTCLYITSHLLVGGSVFAGILLNNTTNILFTVHCFGRNGFDFPF